jgi:hypothetical protein
MAYHALKTPTEGFTKFEVYRYAGDDQVEVLFDRDGDGELESYIFESVDKDADQLKLWLRQVGVWPVFVEKLVDLMWNWRRLVYDLETHRYHLPKSQAHPLDRGAESPVGMAFRFPRPEDANKDLFDPLTSLTEPQV